MLSTGWAVGVPAAVGAAAAFGGAGLLQHQAAQRVPDRPPLRPGLVIDLIRIKPFRWGVVLAASAFALQVFALHEAPLAVVQPILVTGVLFYLGYASVFLQYRPDKGLVLGAVLALGGLAGFLVVSSPAPGTRNVSGVAALPLALGLAGAVAVCVAVSLRLGDELRALPLAVATACVSGATAGIVRSLVTSTDGLDVGIFSHWQLYAIVVVGPVGFLLNQNAFQEGILGSVAVAVIDVGDPLVSICLGIVWFGDTLAHDLLSVVLEVALLALLAGGIWLLTVRAQAVAAGIRERSAGTSR